LHEKTCLERALCEFDFELFGGSWVQPDLVQQVENDLISIMAGGTARDVDILSSFSRLGCLVYISEEFLEVSFDDEFLCSPFLFSFLFCSFFRISQMVSSDP
jgi:hypothetical protein